MWIVILLAFVDLLAAESCEDSDRRWPIKWYFDRIARSCFAYPIGCESPYKVGNEFYDTEEECTLKEMRYSWKKFTLNCPYDFLLAIYTRSNGDPVPYIFSPWLCRKSNGIMRSDICTSSEYCYPHENFAFCCTRRAYTGDEPGGGIFTLTGMGGSENHLKDASIFSPPLKIPVDCNTHGDRNEIEWYPREGMFCLARRSDCLTPAFEPDEAENTYDTQQECMNAHFANWKMSYNLTCMDGFTPVTVGDGPLIFSKSLCGRAHYSDMCNRDEYCAFSNKTTFGFCCRRSAKSSKLSFTIHGNQYRQLRHRRETSIIIA